MSGTITTFNVASTADLNNALKAIDLGGADSAANAAYAINFTQSIALTGQLYAINLASGDTLAIHGNGDTLDGGGAYNGFFDYAGTVAIDNLKINHTKAVGGSGAGGGAGLGGGLFIASGGNVSLSNVTFGGDSAVGGAGGAAYEGNLYVGGGGLEGGRSGFLDTGGGGGIGLDASEETSGEAGIVLGAASGGNGGALNFGSPAGGASGGAGGAGLVPSGQRGGTGGGGGGVGGSDGASTGGSSASDGGNGGNGGFGGGGGGGGSGSETNGLFGTAGQGGSGGFGGGGGGGNGAGGFGGGGGDGGLVIGSAGGKGGKGGFGGGNGSANGNGGGLGAGGAIFVQQGGSLTYSGGSVTGGSVTGGSGGGRGGGNGAALGSGLFLQGNEQITLSASATAPLTISDVIADQSGSGGTGANAGAGRVTIMGPGTVTLSAANTYTGGTTIDQGTLSLQNAHAAGSGAITFAQGRATLLVGSGDAPTNTIDGFAIGNTIDLVGVGTDTVVTANGGNSYTFSGGHLNSAVTLQFDPGQHFAGTRFDLVASRDLSTDITLVNVQRPLITHAMPGQPTTDERTILPFASVHITDPNPEPTDQVVVTLTDLHGVPTDANGTLSGLGLTKVGTGTYDVAGTNPATVQTELQRLVFTPTTHQVAPGTRVATNFTIADTYDSNQTVTNVSTGVLATAVNDTPAISGTHTTQDAGPTAVNPFTGVTVSDPDIGVVDSLTIRLSGAGGTLTGSGLTGAGTSYSFAAASPAALTTELDALSFTPGVAGTTTFLLTALQAAGGSVRTFSDHVTTVVDTASASSGAAGAMMASLAAPESLGSTSALSLTSLFPG